MVARHSCELGRRPKHQPRPMPTVLTSTSRTHEKWGPPFIFSASTFDSLRYTPDRSRTISRNTKHDRSRMRREESLPDANGEIHRDQRFLDFSYSRDYLLVSPNRQPVNFAL